MEMKDVSFIEKYNQRLTSCEARVDEEIGSRNPHSGKAATVPGGETTPGDPFCASVALADCRNAGKAFSDP